jgi:hypothetical protein
MGAKQLEALHQLLPAAELIAYLWNPLSAKADIDCQDDRPRPLWNLRSGPWLTVEDFLTFSGRRRLGKINLWTG